MSNHPITTDRPSKHRARATNHLYRLEGVHAQSELGRRYEDLARGYVAALGGEAGLTDAQRAAIKRAAELTVLAEQERAKALRGELVDPVAFVRLQGLADRAVRALNIKGQPKPKAANLRDIAAARAAAGGGAA